jgi:cytochrome c oxidase cbb3-type subunit 4
MDVNDLRVAITLGGFALFIALMVHTWSRRRQSDHEAAAMLPFLEDEASPPTDRGVQP